MHAPKKAGRLTSNITTLKFAAFSWKSALKSGWFSDSRKVIDVFVHSFLHSVHTFWDHLSHVSCFTPLRTQVAPQIIIGGVFSLKLLTQETKEGILVINAQNKEFLGLSSIFIITHHWVSIVYCPASSKLGRRVHGGGRWSRRSVHPDEPQPHEAAVPASWKQNQTIRKPMQKQIITYTNISLHASWCRLYSTRNSNK